MKKNDFFPKNQYYCINLLIYHLNNSVFINNEDFWLRLSEIFKFHSSANITVNFLGI
jgi:hypothetical protein